MGLETAAYLDELNVANPVVGDLVSAGDDHIRLVKTVLKSTFPGLAGRAWRTQTKSTSYTALATDGMSCIASGAAFTLSLTAAATLGNGWVCWLHAASGNITVDPNGAELVNGAATATITSGRGGILLCDGSAFRLWEFFIPGASGAGSTAADIALTPTGDVSATNVQAGIAELAAEKAPLSSPNLVGLPTAPTPTVGTNDNKIATTNYVVTEIQSRAPGVSGANASGTWPINITGNAAVATIAGSAGTANYATDAAHAASADNGLVAIHAGGSIAGSLYDNALVGTDFVPGFVAGITVDGYGRVTALRYASTEPHTGDGNSSIHPDSMIDMANGNKKWLRDIRVGDIVKGLDKSAEVVGIWTNTLMERSLWDINGVACTPGHLFVTRRGWGAPSPEHYARNSHNKVRVVKTRNGMLETRCLLCEPEKVEKLEIGTEILSSDGTWKLVHTIKEFHVEGPNRRITAHQQVIALFLDDSKVFFADGYAVATLA